MNPFLNPEFWLSLSFVIVLGLIILPPIRKRISNFFDQKKVKIKQQINDADQVYQQAFQTRKKILKDLKVKLEDKNLKQKKQEIQKEFSQKEKELLSLKKQDFLVRQNIIITQTKKRVSDQLLDATERQIMKSKKSLSQDIHHFLHVLHQEADNLKNTHTE